MLVAVCDDSRRTSGRFGRDVLLSIVRYLVAMFLGVMLSCCLFLPTIAELSSSGRGSLDWELLRTSKLNVPLGNFVRDYSIGETSSTTTVSLYCGSLTLVGDFAFFLSRNVRVRHKLIAGALAAYCVAIIAWNPLYVLYSLLKGVYSYHFRYAYVVEASMIVVASAYFARGGRVT